MKILFISSGNSRNGISPIVQNQGESLKKEGMEIDYFTVSGGGLYGYFRAIFKLRAWLKGHRYNLLHAHYGLSAMVAFLGNRRHPLAVSFMGDDVMGSKRPDGSLTGFSRLLVSINRLMAKFCYDVAIVKSDEMKKRLRLEKTEVQPNGVDIETFYPEEQRTVRRKLGLREDARIVLFVSNPDRPEKNFGLAEGAVRLVTDGNVQLHSLHDVSQETVRQWMNAANVLVLTSFHEGSPNVIKEAMACNCPIVSTDVGDVREMIGETEGCFIAGYDPEAFSVQLGKALQYSRETGKTDGRKHLLDKELDAESVARGLKKIYLECIEDNGSLRSLNKGGQKRSVAKP